MEEEKLEPSTSRERVSPSKVRLHTSPDIQPENSVTARPGPSSTRSRPQRPTRLRGRQQNEINSNNFLSLEEKKIILKEEEIKIKKEELELRKLDLEEKKETNKILKEILDYLKNNKN